MITTLLVHANIYHTNLGTISPWDIPPVGLAYLAAILEKHKYPVAIIDAHIEQLSLKELGKRIEQINPNIVGITANIYSAKFALITAHFIKRTFPHITIILGGPFPTTNHKNLIQKHYVDYIVIGEGEYTFLELVEKLDRKEPVDKVKGITYRDTQNKIVVTDPRPLIENLDELPFPAWHLFPNINKYHNLRGVTRRPYIPIMTSRGCPYDCNWCTKYIHGYKFRARSPENVVAEMQDDVNKYNIKEFAIIDDSFTQNQLRVKKICVLIKKAKINVVFNIYNGIRADTVSDSLLKYLTAVGINRITIGVESGNQQVVYKIGKALDLKNVKKAVQLSKKYHLISDGFFMLGHYFDTPKTMEETIQFAINMDFDHAYFFVALPFPGSKLYSLIENNGKFLIDYSLGISSHIVEGKPVFEIPSLPKEVVESKFNESYKRFYFRPKKIISLALLYSSFIFRYKSLEIVRWLISQLFFLLGFLKKKQIKITRT